METNVYIPPEDNCVEPTLPKVLEIGNVSAKPGEVKYGYATSVELRDGTQVGLPVIVANGAEEGPLVVINGATHPTEMTGPAAIQILLRKIVDPVKLRGAIVGFPISNPLGMQFSQYVSPHDGINLGAAYPGAKNGSLTLRIANFIWENAAEKADLVLDLHENVKPCLMFSIVTASQNDRSEARALELAEAFGITVIRSFDTKFPLPGVTSTSKGVTSLAMEKGIPAFTPEFEATTDVTFKEEEHSVRVSTTGLVNVLRKLGMMPGPIIPQRDIQILKGKFKAWGMPLTSRGGILHRIADVGVKLPKGTAIAKIVNCFGDTVETIEMPVDGYIWGWNVGVPPWFNWSLDSGDPVAFVFEEY
jgi:predicted deacylase